ncbi:MAG: hypothetical protein ACRDHU_07555, partial [Actinomycetota bacterium]
MRSRIHAARLAAVTAVTILTTALAGFVAVPAAALPGPDVSIQASASPNPVEVGQEITVTLTVANVGDVAATGVVVTDVLVASLELESALSSLG